MKQEEVGEGSTGKDKKKEFNKWGAREGVDEKASESLTKGSCSAGATRRVGKFKNQWG